MEDLFISFSQVGTVILYLNVLYVVAQYVTQTVEVESADTQRSLVEAQMKNVALQEQLAVQRQLLQELETQLHDSQRTCAQLRTQVRQPAQTPVSPVRAGLLLVCLLCCSRVKLLKPTFTGRF